MSEVSALKIIRWVHTAPKTCNSIQRVGKTRGVTCLSEFTEAEPTATVAAVRANRADWFKGTLCTYTESTAELFDP